MAITRVTKWLWESRQRQLMRAQMNIKSTMVALRIARSIGACKTCGSQIRQGTWVDDSNYVVEAGLNGFLGKYRGDLTKRFFFRAIAAPRPVKCTLGPTNCRFKQHSANHIVYYTTKLWSTSKDGHGDDPNVY